MRYRRIAAALTGVALLVGACSSNGASTAPSAAPSTAASAPASAGAASRRPAAAPSARARASSTSSPGRIRHGRFGGEPVPAGGYDWVTPFETATGCKVTVKVGASSAEMVQLMKTGQYDGVSASGDATLRLIAGGDVRPVNLDLIPNYANVFEGLKNKPHNTVDGVAYGVPHGRGANLLMCNTDRRARRPRQLERGLRGRLGLQGQGHRLRLRDLHRRRGRLPDGAPTRARHHQPVRPRRRPSSPRPWTCSSSSARTSRPYWGTATASRSTSFTSGDMVVGTTWQYQVDVLQGATPPVPVEVVKPKEGATGWSDTWMISSKAKHPNCMYKWMDYIISTAGERHGDGLVRRGAGQPGRLRRGREARRPATATCSTRPTRTTSRTSGTGTPRRRVPRRPDGANCKDFDDWTKAWTEIKG